VPDPLRTRYVVRLQSPVGRDEIPTLCRAAESRLAFAPIQVVHCDVAGLTMPEPAALDAVARLALVAGRHGATVVLLDPAPHLRDVVELAGLSEVVTMRRFRDRVEGGDRRSGRGSRYRGRS
jgi:hypothetical protein